MDDKPNRTTSAPRSWGEPQTRKTSRGVTVTSYEPKPIVVTGITVTDPGPIGSPIHTTKKPAEPQPRRTRQGFTDGRSLRRTGRTGQISTRVKPETVELLRTLCERQGRSMAELLEHLIDREAGREVKKRR